MRLTELEPQFVRREVRAGAGDGSGVVHVPVATAREAHGLQFLCPKCFARNAGPQGTHLVCCWFRGRVPDEAEPGPGRWGVEGSDYRDLTLSPSIQLDGGCNWHGFVRNGEILLA